MFWDDSVGSVQWLAWGSGITISGTTVTFDTVFGDGRYYLASNPNGYISSAVTSLTATSPISVSGSTGAVTVSHANSGVTAGTYNNVTVNATGHVTSGSNAAYVTSSASTSYIPRMSSASSIENSSLYETGTSTRLLGMFTTSPSYEFHMRNVNFNTGVNLELVVEQTNASLYATNNVLAGDANTPRVGCSIAAFGNLYSESGSSRWQGRAGLYINNSISGQTARNKTFNLWIGTRTVINSLETGETAIGPNDPAAWLDVQGTLRIGTLNTGSGDVLTVGANNVITRQTLANLSVGAASSSTNALRIVYNDGPRNLTDRLPNSFARTVNWDFVTNVTVGGAGNYAGVMTWSPWDGTTASTGDSSYQLAFINVTGINGSGVPGLRLRKGIDSTWGGWYDILTSGNWSSYSTFDGLGGKTSGTGIYQTNGSFRAPIFYDSENTNYYVDPNGSSVLLGNLTSYGTIVSAQLSNPFITLTMTSNIGNFGAYVRANSHLVLDTTVSGYNIYILDSNAVGVVKNHGSQSWSSFSDLTLKNVHSIITNNLEKLEDIYPIYYSFNHFKDEKVRIGLIAQEVQKHYPELVTTDPRTGKLMLEYTGLIPILLGAIKELKEELKTIKK